MECFGMKEEDIFEVADALCKEEIDHNSPVKDYSYAGLFGMIETGCKEMAKESEYMTYMVAK